MAEARVFHSADNVGVANDGEYVQFELVDPIGNRVLCAVPYDQMSSVLMGLQSAMQMATDHNSKKPGFHPADASTKSGLKSFTTGQATSLGQPPKVALRVETEGSASLMLMLSLEQAAAIGSDLVRLAENPPDAPKLN